MKNTDLIAAVGGIEKARGIVAGAPDKTADHYAVGDWGVAYFSLEFGSVWCAEQVDWFDSDYSTVDELEGDYRMVIPIHCLRTAIAEHDQHWYGRSEEDELKAYALLSQEKIEGGAWLRGDFSRACNVLNRALASDSDDVSDIAYHVSQNTRVSER